MKKLSALVIDLVVAAVAIAATRRPVYTESALQILSGSVVMSGDGSVTQTFSTAFGAVPKVFTIQQNNAAASTTNFVTPTVSNVVLRSSIAGATSVWFAVGSP
jgi:hypothetical protein